MFEHNFQPQGAYTKVVKTYSIHKFHNIYARVFMIRALFPLNLILMHLGFRCCNMQSLLNHIFVLVLSKFLGFSYTNGYFLLLQYLPL